MRVACWVLLWLEERVKVPKAALHVCIGRHLLESHLREDFPELRPNLPHDNNHISATPGIAWHMRYLLISHADAP